MITISISPDKSVAYLNPCKPHGFLHNKLRAIGGFFERKSSESITLPLSSDNARSLRAILVELRSEMPETQFNLLPGAGKVLADFADSPNPIDAFNVFPSSQDSELFIIDAQKIPLQAFAAVSGFLRRKNSLREISDSVFLVEGEHLPELFSTATFKASENIFEKFSTEEDPFAGISLPSKAAPRKATIETAPVPKKDTVPSLQMIDPSASPKMELDHVALPEFEPFSGFDGSLSSLKWIPLEAYEHIRKDSEKTSSANRKISTANKSAKTKKAEKKLKRSLAQKLSSIGMTSAFDILHMFPLRYIDRSKPKLIRQIAEGEDCAVLGTVANINTDYAKRMVRITFEDMVQDQFTVTFFQQVYLGQMYRKGDQVIVSGRLAFFRNMPTLDKAKVDKIGSDRAIPMIPVYPQSGTQEITTWDILAMVKETLGRLGKTPLEEPFEQEIRDLYRIPTRNEAYVEIHLPRSPEHFADANRRLVYEELYRLQVIIQKQRQDIVSSRGLPQNALETPTLDSWRNNLPYALTGAQSRAMSEIKANMASPNPMYRLIQGDVGSGKAQPLDALVLTPLGYTQMGRIRKNDSVVTPDGSIAKVLQIFPQGERDIFKVSFSDGSSVESDGEHLWNVRTSTACHRGNPAKTLTLNEIRNSLKEKNGASKWHVELTKPIDLGEGSPLPVDPYLVGFLLGDGSLSGGKAIYFSSADLESAEELSKLIPADYSVKKQTQYGYAISRIFKDQLAPGLVNNNDEAIKFYSEGYSVKNIANSWGLSQEKVRKILIKEGIERRPSSQKNSITESLRALGLMGCTSRDKFVPEIYKNTSMQNRLAILQGLLDTDGTVSNQNGNEKRGATISFSTISDALSEDVAWLVRSLGGVARIAPRNRKSGFSWHVFISLPNELIPFRLSRKRKLVKNKVKYHPKRRAIREVTYVGKKEAQCILIDHPDHLYVTDNFTATHNTVVASYAVLNTLDNGHQSALMAPTEILAEQLFNGIAKDVDGLISSRSGMPIHAVFLAGKTTAAQARKIRAGLADGTVDIVVGTHAILTPDTKFKDLGTVVIDEQHRFGVEQRSILRNERADGKTPDMLLMTATPIPRSSAMVLYGDLDLTILDELPPGRTPIETIWKRVDAQQAVNNGRLEPWEDIRNEVRNGHQAYVVASLVEDNEKLAAQSVQDAFEKLSGSVFPEFRLGMVHGKQKRPEREEVMKSFAAGEIDILIATTVIEVGVNVPNSTVMVVLDPGRFGISQLHQIRGRVGRSNLPSRCWLVGDTKTSDGEFRLNALVESTDGFYLSEKDLELRGEGTLFSTKQSGQGDLFLAKIHEHMHVLEVAKADVSALLKKDPRLTSKTGRIFAMEVEDVFGDKEIKS